MQKAEPYVPVMCEAHGRGDVDAIRKLLEAHPELEEMGPDANHIPWLHWAAEHGQTGVIEFWLDRGWDVNRNVHRVPKADGLRTALHWAKDAATTRYLLSRGALVNAWNRWDGTPLHRAVVGAVEPSQKGRRRPEGASMDQIRVLLEAGADFTLVDGEGKGRTPLAVAIKFRRKTAEHFLRDAGAPEKGRRPIGSPAEDRARGKKLDLQKDFETVYEYVARRVRDFDPAKHKGLGGPGEVKMVHLGFDFVHEGWVALVFDTRPAAESDGDWTSKLKGNTLKLPRWQHATERNLEEAITLVLPDGSQTALPANTELAVPLGDMLKAVLLKARASGVFAAMPKAPGCQFHLEHFDGYYAELGVVDMAFLGTP